MKFYTLHADVSEVVYAFFVDALNKKDFSIVEPILQNIIENAVISDTDDAK